MAYGCRNKPWQPDMDGRCPSTQPFLRKKRKRDSCAFFFEIKNMKEKTGGNMKTRRTLKEKLLAVLLALAMLLPAVPNLGIDRKSVV